VALTRARKSLAICGPNGKIVITETPNCPTGATC
jgi:hypothetical protein